MISVDEQIERLAATSPPMDTLQRERLIDRFTYFATEVRAGAPPGDGEGPAPVWEPGPEEQRQLLEATGHIAANAKTNVTPAAPATACMSLSGTPGRGRR